MKSRRNLVSSNLNSKYQIRSQFRTWHDSSAVVACAKLWSDLIIIFFILGQRVLYILQNLHHELINTLWSWPLIFVDSNKSVTLTHWGRVTHICVGKLTTIGSNNGLSPGRRQAIIWTIAGILLIGPLGTNFSEILIGIQTFSFTKMHLKMSSAKWRPFVSASMC